MLRMAGYSIRGVAQVQSPVADTSIIGRGAINAPISILEVFLRMSGAFSHIHPPCMEHEIIFTGAETFTRVSTAHNRNVCVTPPDAPVQAICSGSTSGSV